MILSFFSQAKSLEGPLSAKALSVVEALEGKVSNNHFSKFNMDNRLSVRLISCSLRIWIIDYE